MVKKYLLGSIAAMATLMFATSCNNEDAFDAAQDINVAKYEAQFIKKFGQPSPTQTWGFGSNSSSTRGAGSLTATFDFPGDADASNFLSDVPNDENITKITDGNVQQVNGWIDETFTGQLNVSGMWDGQHSAAGTLYIKGNCDFSNRYFYFASGTIYLLEGATLTLSSSASSNLQGGTTIYIAKGAKIVAQGEFKLNKGMYVYNHGTIEAPSLTLNEKEWNLDKYNVLYNGSTGKIKVTGLCSPTKEYAVIVNDGEIECGEFNTAGSSHLMNNGKMTVYGPTIIDSNGNTWVNNEEYITEDFLYTAGSNRVINNCRLTVNNLFKINLGDSDVNGFRMDANCGVLTTEFEAAGPAHIYMGSNSVFKVLNEAKMNITKAGYGIYGPEEGEYAVFQAKDITCKNARQRFNASYLNNLYVVCDSHFDFGYDNLNQDLWADHVYTEGDGPFYYLGGGAVLYANGEKPNITIPETPCNPGFGGGDGDDDEFIPVIRVMAEDLTINDGSDFDFNDVVFDVQWTATGAKIRLNAAGGTLPLTIEGVEVHAKFAEANPGKNITTKTMMNTASGAKNAYVKPIFEITGNFKNADNEYDAKLITVKVNKGTEEKPNWLELKAEKGKVAAKIGVEPKCDWCDERQDIELKYSNFAKWVRGEVENFY